MAYLNFAELGGGLRTATPSRRAPANTGFSPLEWSVIAMARSDGLSTLKAPGRVSKAMGSLFGTWRDSRLADQRLEALRRVAVLAWRQKWAVPSSELRAFEAAGFTADHYEALQASIGRSRAQAGRRTR